MSARRKAIPRGRRERKCLTCKCTDSVACDGGCGWVSDRIDLCSQCVVELARMVLDVVLLAVLDASRHGGGER
jgi:hypothetical protein